MLIKLRNNKAILEEKFKDHPQPVLHGLLGTILEDSPTGCVLLGQRNVEQVIAAAELGESLSNQDADWVKDLYKK